MATNLTGDFDVIAEFAIPAANRVLAAMHRTERFPHSATFRVDDHRRPDLNDAAPSVVGLMDGYGEPIANQQKIGRPKIFPGLLASMSPTFSALDAVVNSGIVGAEQTPIEPSLLRGRAQLQLFPPTIEVTDSTGENVTIRLELMTRYFSDPKTASLAEFIRGDLTITAPVNQVASDVGDFIDIDIKSANLVVNFSPTWSSKPLTAEDLTAINNLLKNAIRTSFLPSKNEIPANISHIQFKTSQGTPRAISMLLDMKDADGNDVPAGNRATANNTFLGGGDDFAFGVGADFVKAAFEPTLEGIRTTPVDPVSFTIDGLIHTWHITYRFVLNSAEVDLQNGKIVIVVKGHASTSSWTPNFDFTVKLSFSLAVSGDTATLVPGDVSIDTSSWIINRFKGGAESAIRNVRDASIADNDALGAVADMLSAEKNLGGFIDSLLQPARQGNAAPLPKGFWLTYNSVDISPAGIALHGALQLTSWPAAHVEFEQIPTDGGDRFGIGAIGTVEGPDYSALKTWIPGGIIDSYEWKSQSQTQPGFFDEHRFVLLHQPPQATSGTVAATPAATIPTRIHLPITGYVPLCVTVHGTRLSSFGPGAPQLLTATACGINSFPIVGGLSEDAVSEMPMIAITQPDVQGNVTVAGHTAARVADRGSAPNLIVHFGDRNSAGALERITEGLGKSGRQEASTAILAVFSPGDLANSRHIPGVTYSEDQKGIWERRFGVRISRRPTTLIVSPDGKVVWQHEGEIDAAALAEKLSTSLVRSGRVRATMKPQALRIGQLPPNFLFEYERGHEITLRKINKGPIALGFWKSSSSQSLELLRELSGASPKSDAKRTIVLAINDGEPVELARKVASENNLSAIVVPDPLRQIAVAYDVNTWPTTVWLDSQGLVAAIRYGRLAGDDTASPFESAEGTSPAQNSTAQRSDRR